MIDAICDIISIHSAFTASEIRDAYDLCNSFDVTIRAIEYARISGRNDLVRIVKQYLKGNLSIFKGEKPL